MNNIKKDSININDEKYNNLISKNNKYKLIMQDDGNLIINNNKNISIWKMNVINKPYKLYLHDNGNLVIYDSLKKSIWETNTTNKGKQPYSLVVSNIGDLEIQDSNQKIIWSSIFPPEGIKIKELPLIIPETQSQFYMPLLTHAYYIVKNMEITNILRIEIAMIKKLSFLNHERYNAIIEGIVYLLNNNIDYINLMDKSYNNLENKGDKYSTQPSEKTIGHITGNLQDEILSKSYLSQPKNDLYFTNFSNNSRIIKNKLDEIIYRHYYPSIYNQSLSEYKKKYLKYKNKYLSLKNRTNI
jgi:hypothetical protein